MKRYISIFSALVIAVSIGCSGSMQGVIRKNAKRVLFNYSDPRIGKAIIKVEMPGGERFKGRLVKISSGDNETESDAKTTVVNSVSFEEVDSFSGNCQAELTGNMGNSMKCRFRVADHILGLSTGGFGICQTADGRVIDIFF